MVRNAEQKDGLQLDELLTELIHDEVQYDPNLNDGCVIADNYGSRIGLEGHKLLVAEEAGEIVGYLYGFVHHVPEIWVKPVAIVDALYVKKEYRRKGYAGRLLSEFQNFARENGACRIDLKVVSDNLGALELYQKHSFYETKKYMCLDLCEEIR